MGIHIAKMEPHWSYFLAIEQDLDRLSRFVEFDEQNFRCFSIEIAHLLLTAAAETDVVCKQLCVQKNQNSKAANIIAYRKEILAIHPRLPRFVVTLPRYGLVMKPWSNWNQKRKTDNPPVWWTAYNKIKHHRHKEFHQGNLKNAINAVAGLFVMVLYLYKQKAELGELLPSAQLLRVTKANFRGVSAGGADSGVSYVL